MHAVHARWISDACPNKAHGNATLEVIAALLAMMPFILGIPLLGKQFDMKHKGLDAARYVVWERTVWRNDAPDNHKSDAHIALETRDRMLGHPAAGLISAANLSASGPSENPLWRDASGRPLIAYVDGRAPISIDEKSFDAPVRVGYLLVPALAQGAGSGRTIEAALGVTDLKLGSHAFMHAHVAFGARNVLAGHDGTRDMGSSRANQDESRAQLVMNADAAILSDAWSVRDENSLRRRVDDLTTDELVESLEVAGQVIALQAPGKGKPLYGEGRFAANPDLRPASNALPAAYVAQK